MPELPEEFIRLLRQLGFTPNADGSFDLEQLMASVTWAMNQSGQFGGEISWTTIKDAARTVSHQAGPDPFPDASVKRQIAEAGNLADLWLDEVIPFPRLNQPITQWTRAEWIEQTIGVWETLVSPVTENLKAEALLLTEVEGGEPPAQVLRPLMQNVSSSMLTAQIGQALGELPSRILTATDLGLPLVHPPRAALLPHNIALYADGLAVELPDLQIFLAVRETARQRLFSGVGWLGTQLLALVGNYARNIKLDHDQIRRQMEQKFLELDLGDFSLESMSKTREDLAGTLFTTVDSPEQREILDRLETLSALVEGWVDDVVSRAISGWLPNSAALNELMRRQRASAGTAKSALTRLIGLELRPRRVRDAANLWAALRTYQGPQAAAHVWSHPDLLPTATDLDDPLGFASRPPGLAKDADFDQQLADWLSKDQGPETQENT